MISFVINLLVGIIKFIHAENGNETNLKYKQCIECMLEILSYKKLMEFMKCSDGNRQNRKAIPFKDSFKNILSIPSKIIIDTTLIYLNEKKGDVQEW